MGILSRIFGTPSDCPQNADFSEVSGKWQGYYTQYDERRPISAMLTQSGNRITGTMTDSQTESERSLFDATVHAGLPPGSDEQIDQKIRQLIPDAGTEPIRVKTNLPNQSQLSGVIDGGFVRFTKTYRGEQTTAFHIGDKAITQATDGHPVQYSGRLSSDYRMIEGIWTIHEPQAPKGYIDGAFVLRKV